jgi:CelD/BcsL family acetyltransferase involved in cellulose biosynthesis
MTAPTADAAPIAARQQTVGEIRVVWKDSLGGLAGAHLPHGTEQAPDLFHTLEWFQHLSECGIESSDALRVAQLALHDGSGFLLPLQVVRRARAAVLGRSVCSLSNFYSSLYGPIGAPENVTPEACTALACSIRDDIAGSAVIDLQPLDQEAPLARYLPGALQVVGYAVDTYFCFGNWYLPVAGRRWAEIEPGIPSKQRNTIKRGRKKLADAGEWSLHIHTEPGPALEQAIQDYEAIYARSWKQPEPFVDFVPGLCRWTAARGWLRLGVVRLGDTPIAAQIWFVHQRKALIFKLAYDEAHKRLSAGSVLTTELMRHVVDVDGADEIDYLTGDDAYKADWMTHRRERIGLLAFRRSTVTGLCAFLKHRLGRRLARWRSACRPTTAPEVQRAPNVD